MEEVLRELSTTIESGEAMLFTGAGFSAAAHDLDGRPLPDSAQMIRELWPICFEGGEPDDSTLADLYGVALRCATDRLRAYVGRRLRVGDAALPAHLASWLAAPWRRIYTLNVDDLEVAVQRQRRLPRPLRSVSAIDPDPVPPSEGETTDARETIDVVHLNGMAGADAAQLTFSTMQYAARLCARDREYERLVDDLARAPFVFAGTSLDEITLWQHLELHRRHVPAEPTHRPRSFLVSSSLSRARQVLLESFQIRWVQATIADVAERILIRA